MTERLTLKKLSDELEKLRTQVLELEERLERKIEAGLEGAAATLESGSQASTTPGRPSGIDAEQRQRLIAEEAYLIAEQRGFQGGDPALDWVEAEKRVDYRLMQVGKPRQAAIRTSRPRKKTARSASKSGTGKKAASKATGPAK